MAFYYLMRHVKLHVGNFALSKESLSFPRKQIASKKDFCRWGVIECIRYVALGLNINIMSNRHVFEKMSDASRLIKDVYMMVDFEKEGLRMAKKTKNKIAMIYAMYSSERQNEQSIKGQSRVINQFAEKEGYAIIDNYIDRAMTRRNDGRSSF